MRNEKLKEVVGQAVFLVLQEHPVDLTKGLKKTIDNSARQIAKKTLNK